MTQPRVACVEYIYLTGNVAKPKNKTNYFAAIRPEIKVGLCDI